jgi:hypothetical protein
MASIPAYNLGPAPLQAKQSTSISRAEMLMSPRTRKAVPSRIRSVAFVAREVALQTELRYPVRPPTTHHAIAKPREPIPFEDIIASSGPRAETSLRQH